MTEVQNLADWKSIVEYSPDGPKHHVLVDTKAYRAVLVGVEAGGKIPPHPSTDATYHVLEGSGWMIVEGERFPISTGSTVVVPAQAVRGVEAQTRLAFLGSHGGHGEKTGHQHNREATNNRRPMLMFGLMALSMLVVMAGLWRIGASPMAMMFSGFNGMGIGVWGAMLLPMLGLLGMGVMMVVMYRTLSGSGGGMMQHDHAGMMARQKSSKDAAPGMQMVTYTIPAISCAGCKETIEARVAQVKGVSSVHVDVGSRRAVIGFDEPATKVELERVLSEMGYPVEAN